MNLRNDGTRRGNVVRPSFVRQCYDVTGIRRDVIRRLWALLIIAMGPLGVPLNTFYLRRNVQTLIDPVIRFTCGIERISLLCRYSDSSSVTRRNIFSPGRPKIKNLS